MDSFLQFQPHVTLLKDIVGIVSSMLLGIIAIIGLTTWKKQIKGKTEYELARRLLRAVYKTRDAIQYVRNPYASSSENFVAMKEANLDLDPFDPGFHQESQFALYKFRWNEVQKAMIELDLEAFEAEVLWGKEIKDLIVPLRKQVNVLRNNIDRYLSNLKKPSGHLLSEDVVKEIDQVIYSFEDLTDPNSENPYNKQTAKVISEIEEFLIPRIKL